MNKPATLTLIAQLLSGCQSTSGAPGGEGQNTALQDPVIATSIAADLSTDVSPFLAKGSVLAFNPDQTAPLSDALAQSLIGHGYTIKSDREAKADAIELQIWSMEVDGDLLVRLSTPSHRLSKIYRKTIASDPSFASSSPANAQVTPAGPLLVETIGTGGPSS